jgi:hypothetical protein
MQTLEMALSKLVQDDVIDYDEAIGVSMYPKEVEKKTPDHFALAAAMAAGESGNGSGAPGDGAAAGAAGGEPPRVAST